MNLRGVLTALLLLAASLCSTATTHAQDEAVLDARAYFEAGLRALEAEDYPQAAQLFQSSYAQSPRTSTLCNLALTFDRWGDHRAQAIQAYDRCALEDESGRFRAHATDRAAALRAELEASPTIGPAEEGSSSEAWERPEDGTPTGRIDVDAPEGAPAPEAPSEPRPLLYLGIAAVVVGAGALTAGVVLHLGVNRDDEYLQMTYPDMRIPPGPDADLLEDAETRRTFSIVAYAAGGLLMAAGAIFIGLDLAGSKAQLTLSPTRGGVFANARVTF